MNVILLSVLSVAVVALLCGILLVVAAKVMAVEENPLFPALRECLPGANCGACGYAGCDGYANALAAGEETRTNLCVPGGSGCAAALAEALGTEAAAPVEAKVAVVLCGGTCDKAVGEGADKACAYGCIGCGACASACPVSAIRMENGIAVVDKDTCVGCGLCEKTCPRHVIALLPKNAKVIDRCVNPEMGKAVMTACKAGCIGCTKCSKVCPEGAITMENNLAVVDHEKCTGCGTCVDACPTKCMTRV